MQKKYIEIVLTTLVLITTDVSFASNRNLCLNVFTTSHRSWFWSQLTHGQSKISEKLLNRYWGDPFVNLISNHVRTNTTGKEVFIYEPNHIAIALSITKIENHLFVDIPGISFIDINLGQRPQGVNMEFIKLLTGITKGIESILSDSQNIKSITITAQYIRNMMFIPMLSELGYTQFVDSRGSPAIHYRREYSRH